MRINRNLFWTFVWLAIVGFVVSQPRAAKAQAPTPPFTQCPPVNYAPSCGVLVVINPNGSLRLYTDPSVGPYDGNDDALVGVQNNSGATVFGISLSGPYIYGFDGDGICAYVSCSYPAPTSYEGPNMSFTITNANQGIINFTGNGLANGKSTYFGLEGAPANVRLSSSVTIDPGHGTLHCPGGRTGATGPTNFPATNPPAGHLVEYQLAYSIATQLQTQLVNAGYQVAITKSDVTSCPTYSERTTIANNARSNIFVSVHLDGYADQSIDGTSVLYNDSKSSAAQLSTFIVSPIATGLGTANKGIKVRDDLAVLKTTMSHMTSSLAEVATLSNVGGDETIMHSPASTTTAANAIFTGIDAFVNQ